MITGDITGSFDTETAFVSSLATVHNYVGSLMVSWANTLVQDNRKGVLAGRDKDDQPVVATSYRTSFTQAGYDRPTYVKFVPNPFGGPDWKTNVSGMPREGFKPGPSGNLTTKQYRQQSGPPLAPRGMASRIISNYLISPLEFGNGQFGVEGRWTSVESKNGTPFLPFHFNSTLVSSTQHSLFGIVGIGRGKNLPRRNMAGLRAWGKKRAREDLRKWIEEVMTEQREYFRKAGHIPDFAGVLPRRRPR
jgi:hypothetical protein